MKKTVLIAICLLTGLFITKAEEKKGSFLLKGHVQIEGTTDDIPYVTITVQDENANVITRQASDVSGKFAIQLTQSGTYRLIFSAVGYATTAKDATIHENEKSIDMGTVGMPEGVELKEINVVVQKPLIKSDPDKLVYSVEADPEAQSNTLMEMLRKVPLLSVDSEGEVTLNGQSNYKVLVNGKSSSLMSNNFKEVIKSMPASSIRDIEVITNPSSKYEAEGAGGIINIITARNSADGYTGSAGTYVNSLGGFGANAYIAATAGKFSFSTNLYANRFNQREENYSDRTNFDANAQVLSYMTQRGKSKVKGSGNSLNFEAGYEIDTFNLISASAWGYFGSYDVNNRSETQNFNPGKERTGHYNNRMKNKFQYGSLSGNIDYQHSFAKKDKMLTASYKLDYNPENAQDESYIEGLLNYVSYGQKSDNNSYGVTHTFQLDYFDPLTEMHQIEAGVKGMLRRNFSEADYFLKDLPDSEWFPDTGRVNDLDYDQYITGVYAGYMLKIKKVTAKTGLRAEYTWNDGVFKEKEANTGFNNTFFNLIPYVNLTYALKPAQTVKLSYTQRLYRPGIWNLNPYRNTTEPSDISFGNPKLEAEVSHSFAASYGQFDPKFNLNVELNGSITDNSIQRYSYVEDGIRYSTYGNIGSSQRYGMNVYTSYRPSGKFSININGRGTYMMLEANNQYGTRNDGFVFGGNLGSRLELWKGGSVSANIGGSSRRIMLQGKANGWYYSSLGMTQKLLKDKIDLSLYFSDPFSRKINFKSDLEDTTFALHSENYRWGQIVRISLTYRFGKMNTQVKKARRGIVNDDQSGGEGQGGGSTQGGGQ
ncbi:MAG: TonB-dependent receptor [Tannerella sp.]|jgi:outer membrane receptor protein involved in Fe transport|nr:TonB-dependent receptor [Tannerella sp.]